MAKQTTLLGFYTDNDGKVKPITQRKGNRKAKKAMQTLRITAAEAAIAREVMAQRSLKAIAMDMKRLAKIAPTFEAWLKAPNRYDLPNIDTPDYHAQAKVIADVAEQVEPEQAPVIVVTAEGSEQPHAEFQIFRAEGTADKKDRDPRRSYTPDREAILDKAIELYQKDMAMKGLPTITAEESELKEGGYWEQARELLMYSAPRVVNEQVLAYIDSLRAELEQMGYTIVPM